MRKLLVLPVIAATLALFSVQVGASGANSCFGPPVTNGSSQTATCTSNFHNAPIPVPLAVPCPPMPGVGSFTNANGVLHGTFNSTGFWITGTITGDFDFFSATFPISGPPVIGPQIGTGHGTIWFGVEDQQKSFVEHFTENVQITFFDGTTGSAHANGDMTFNAQGELTASPFNAHCN